MCRQADASKIFKPQAGQEQITPTIRLELKNPKQRLRLPRPLVFCCIAEVAGFADIYLELKSNVI